MTAAIVHAALNQPDLENRITRIKNSPQSDYAENPGHGMIMIKHLQPYKIPDVSIVVINVHRIAWAKGCGELAA
jgi:hypothetical protein